MVLVAAASMLQAQCGTAFVPATTTPGMSGPVFASVRWDPDGSGPQQARLVFGGQFTSSFGTAVNNIAAMVPGSVVSDPLGAGLDGPVYALAVTATGDLLAGGAFLRSGSTYLGSLARWDGTSWQPIGGGVASQPWQSVYALAVLPTGDLAVGGVFTQAGATPAYYVARWDGSSWHPLGSGANSWVGALAVLPNGDLVAGGEFTVAGGVAASHVARWNGTAWSPLGAGVDDYVTSLVVLPNGDLVAGGYFQTAGGQAAPHVARWSAGVWSGLGGGCSGPVQALAVQPNGDVVAGGAFLQAGGQARTRVARFDGAAWQALGPGCSDTVRTLLPQGDGSLLVGGDFLLAGGASLSRLAIWAGSAWRGFGVYSDPGQVTSAVEMPNGEVVVATSAGLLRWDGAAWVAFPGAPGIPTCLAVNAQGHLAAGVAQVVWLWNGTAWQSLGAPSTSSVGQLLWAPNGELLATCFGPVFRWSANVWTALPGSPSDVFLSVGVRANGQVIGVGMTPLGGPIGDAQPFLARWTGTAWLKTLFGQPFHRVRVADPVPLANGDMLIAGDFGGTANVLRWNGSTITALGAFGSAMDIALLPTGDVVASSDLATQPTARWNGAAWVPLVGTVGHHLLLPLANGDLLAFGLTPWTPMPGFGATGHFTPTCRAAANSTATGCVGPAGPLQLLATSAAWRGTTVTTRASGFAANAVGISVLGFGAQHQPLGALHPAGLPGCDLLVALDAVTLRLPVAGVATEAVALPNAPWVVGWTLLHQFLQVEIGGAGALLSLSSSNALALSIGGYY